VTHNASMDGVCEYCQDDTDWDSASPPSSQVHSTMSTLNQFIDNLSTFLVQAYFPAFCYNLGMLRVAKRAWPWQSLHKRLESRNCQHISRQDLCLRLSQSHERTDQTLGQAGPIQAQSTMCLTLQEYFAKGLITTRCCRLYRSIKISPEVPSLIVTENENLLL
jgi:hypothetical protein